MGKLSDKFLGAFNLKDDGYDDEYDDDFVDEYDDEYDDYEDEYEEEYDDEPRHKAGGLFGK